MFDNLLALIAPHECLACGAEGSLLCPPCSDQTRTISERCYKCLALSPDSRTCDGCRRASPLTIVQAATSYDDAPRDLIWKLKFAHARAAIAPMTRLMAARLVFDEDILLVPVPTATGRVRQRGFDQAELLAKRLAAETGLPFRRLLGRHGQARQVGARRAERLRHLTTAFRPLHPAVLAGRHIILVDDVLTTGATLEAAARTLRRAGAKRVDAVVFAQA